ncbi:hypothetical protein [Actinocorallia libanotica]|uniref:Uncharacterized protein n=1 Tax=Actinocorallia libanotica TaxID=46162 RepID=A0ABN1R8M0_9ACTN
MSRVYAGSSFCYRSGTNLEPVLSDDDPLEFLAEALRSRVFHPAVLDVVTGTRTTDDVYGRDMEEHETYSYRLNLDAEEITCLRALLPEPPD